MQLEKAQEGRICCHVSGVNRSQNARAPAKCLTLACPPWRNHLAKATIEFGNSATRSCGWLNRPLRAEEHALGFTVFLRHASRCLQANLAKQLINAVPGCVCPLPFSIALAVGVVANQARTALFEANPVSGHWWIVCVSFFPMSSTFMCLA